MLRRFLSVATILALGTVAVAQTDVVAERRAIMKRNGQMTRVGGQMAKGEIPFDKAKADEIYKDYLDAAARFPTLFPPDSKTGGDTTASPAVWENKADFDQRFVDWAAEIRKVQASTQDLDSFRASFGTVTKACGSCHQVYRIKT